MYYEMEYHEPSEEQKYETNQLITILDDPFICINCRKGFNPKMSKIGFEMIDKELCYKCLRLSKKIYKLEQTKLENEMKMFIRKYTSIL